jgi:glutathione peroxidase
MNAITKVRRAQAARIRASSEIRMTNALDFTFPKLGGGTINLRDYAGKALLIVNVASACGFTSQYRELQALWEAKRNAGLIVLGVPCNDFGGQEPGDDAKIAEFCDKQYHVTFPMTGKVEIGGQNRHPFYQWIAAELGAEALPRWNFHKYLIGKDGTLEESFPSKDTPLGVAVLGAVEKALHA